MILIIDTIGKVCKVAVYNGQNLRVKKWQWRSDTGTEVLRNLKVLLKKNKTKMTEINVIGVNRGPGSYTGTRVGMTIANALGWSLKIPVIGYSNREPEKVVKEIFQKLKFNKIPSCHFPSPIYK
jgi:tRNA threonylcarbamoyladenosine biosynthesis protein TsaB